VRAGLQVYAAVMISDNLVNTQTRTTHVGELRDWQSRDCQSEIDSLVKKDKEKAHQQNIRPSAIVWLPITV